MPFYHKPTLFENSQRSGRWKGDRCTFLDALPVLKQFPDKTWKEKGTIVSPSCGVGLFYQMWHLGDHPWKETQKDSQNYKNPYIKLEELANRWYSSLKVNYQYNVDAEWAQIQSPM